MVFIKFSHTNSSHFDFSKSTQTLSTYIAFERFLADMKTLPFMFLPSYTTLIHDKWPHKNWIKRLSRSVSQSEQTNDKVPKAYHLPFIWRIHIRFPIRCCPDFCAGKSQYFGHFVMCDILESNSTQTQSNTILHVNYLFFFIIMSIFININK